MNKQGQRTAREHFRLLYTLLHALAQSGAKVVDTGRVQPIDPHSAVTSPEDGPGVEYLVQLSPGDADLIIQVYVLQAMIVADARVVVR
jgi:hypothetical protein